MSAFPPGVLILPCFSMKDTRGGFLKPYSAPTFPQDFVVKEMFLNVSDKGVVRGMHFQKPPAAHDKAVFCVSGQVLDVLLDIRIGSPTYGKCFAFHLDAQNPKTLFIPKGVAHGFQSLENSSSLLYLTSTPYHSECDQAINPLSMGFTWPIESPHLSERDSEAPPLDLFLSPFTYDGRK